MSGTTYNISDLLFYFCILALLYTYGGYHLIIYLLSRWQTPAKRISLEEWPEISMILVMKNEDQYAVERIENLIQQYPLEKFEILVYLDAPTDNSFEILRDKGFTNVSLFHEIQARGKSYCIAEGLKQAKAEYVVFADARQKFQPGAIKSMISLLANPEVGAVSGELIIGDSDDKKSISSTYWELEKILRKAESTFSSVIGCTGAIYAAKREYCPIIPPDTLLDDVVIPMTIAHQGKRVLFDSQAVAIDPLIPTPRNEFKRKVRTLAGNYQMLFRYPSWMLPWKNALWWQLISHKYIRLSAPFFALYILGYAIYNAQHPFFLVLALAHLIGIVLGVVGIILGERAPKVVFLLASYLLLNLASVKALYYYLSRSYESGWSAK